MFAGVIVLKTCSTRLGCGFLVREAVFATQMMKLQLYSITVLAAPRTLSTMLAICNIFVSIATSRIHRDA